MGDQVLKVDTAPRAWFICLGVFAFVFILVAFIVGAAGPGMEVSEHAHAYGCPGHSHIWNDSICTGLLLREGSKWSHTLGEFNLFNKLWVLDITPFKWNPNGNRTWNQELLINVSILGTHDESLNDAQWKHIADETKSVNLICNRKNTLQCSSFTLIDIQYIDYPYYRVELILPPSSGREYVGDMKFSLYTYNTDFSKMELGIRLAYLFISFLALIAFLTEMRKTPFDEWTFEQKSALFLVVGLLMYNDIFFAFEFLIRGWFFEFINSLFEVVFTAGLMFYWLVAIEKLRGNESQFSLNSKATLVSIYTILAVVFFTWVRIRAAKDPIYSNRDDLFGLFILFYLVSVTYAALLIWVIVLLILSSYSVPKGDLRVRFVFVAIPTVVCVTSIVAALFTGTIGPFNRNALLWVYLSSVYNVFVWIMLMGYVPSKTDEVSEGESVPIREQELQVVSSSTLRQGSPAAFTHHDEL